MAGLSASVERVLAKLHAGYVDEDDAWSEVTGALLNAMDRGDPEVPHVARALVARRHLSPALVAELAAFARVCIASAPRGPTWEGLGLELGEELARRVVTAISSPDVPRDAVPLVVALPAEWCTAELLQHVSALDVGGGGRRRLDRHVLPAAVRLRGPQAFEALVRPHLATGTPDAAALLVDAYLQPGIDAAGKAALIEHLRSQADVCPSPTLLRLVVRLSIERQDADAARLAQLLARREDLPPTAPPVLGLVLWLSGARAQGIELAGRPPAWHDAFGWATQASRAVAAFLAAADATPQEVLDICAAGPGTEHPGSSIAAVGALVGRLAFLRMRAYAALGDAVWAAREAAAVLAQHAYRGYDLHMQSPDEEFEGALADRLCVTPAEVDEARAVLDTAGGADIGHLALHEGRLVLTAGRRRP